MLMMRWPALVLEDEAEEALRLDKVRATLTLAGLWGELATDGLVLDAELLRWSAEADQLLRPQYASTSAVAPRARSPRSPGGRSSPAGEATDGRSLARASGPVESRRMSPWHPVAPALPRASAAVTAAAGSPVVVMSSQRRRGWQHLCR